MKILFSILEVIYTLDEVRGQELSEKCRKGVQYIGTLCYMQNLTYLFFRQQLYYACDDDSQSSLIYYLCNIIHLLLHCLMQK